jgi:hypothetical protein
MAGAEHPDSGVNGGRGRSIYNLSGNSIIAADTRDVAAADIDIAFEQMELAGTPKY